MNPPEAEVIDQRSRKAIVRCPLCKKPHVYPITYSGRQRRAPQCGQFQNADIRAAGIAFTIDHIDPERNSHV